MRLHVDAARRFVATAEQEYDLILLSPPAGGRSTLAENFATTVEALTADLQRLAPGGLLVLPHPLRLPPRDSLKLTLTAIEALERLGVARPAGHLALLRAWDSVLLLVRRTPFGPGELGTIDSFAEALGFDLGCASRHAARGGRSLQPPRRSSVLRRRRRPGLAGPRALRR